MRRTALLLVTPLLAAGLLAGCGSAGHSSGAGGAVRVSGSFDKTPKVTIPGGTPASALSVTTLIHGKGQTFTKGESILARAAVYIWSKTSHKLASSTYGQAPVVFGGELLPGLEKAMLGQRLGSRVVAVIPPKDGFGTAGNSQAGITPTDTLVYVVDMLTPLPKSAVGHVLSSGGSGLPTVTDPASGTSPVITMPSSKPPSGLVTKTLIKGSGPAVATGDELYVQYVGAIWQTGKVFDSSWARQQPFNFALGAPNTVIEGWTKGLAGATVGSRVMLVIPPVDGYGKTGSSTAGITGTDNLVFVVDILATVPATQAG